MNQAELLNKEIKVDHVVALNVPNDEIVNRLKDRWVHAPSGRVYNLLWNPPKVAVRNEKIRRFFTFLFLKGKDDETGESLSQRDDDKPEVILSRLQTYDKNTQPITDFYR